MYKNLTLASLITLLFINNAYSNSPDIDYSDKTQTIMCKLSNNKTIKFENISKDFDKYKDSIFSIGNIKFGRTENPLEKYLYLLLVDSWNNTTITFNNNVSKKIIEEIISIVKIKKPLYNVIVNKDFRCLVSESEEANSYFYIDNIDLKLKELKDCSFYSEKELKIIQNNNIDDIVNSDTLTKKYLTLEKYDIKEMNKLFNKFSKKPEDTNSILNLYNSFIYGLAKTSYPSQNNLNFKTMLDTLEHAQQETNQTYKQILNKVKNPSDIKEIEVIQKDSISNYNRLKMMLENLDNEQKK